jgi:DNA primase
MTLREVLIRHGIPFKMGQHDNLRLNCLFCQENGHPPDTRFLLSIKLTNGAAHCFHCSFRTKSSGFLLIKRKLRIEAAIDGETITQVESTEKPQLPEDYQVLDHSGSDLDSMAIHYLRKRGITTQQIARKRIGISLMGKFAYRAIFPVWFQKELKGIVGRDFTGQQEPKYLNSRGEKGLYNWGIAERVLLSEGVFKALRIERLETGFRSMATLGRSITDFQIEQLKAAGCKEVVVWPDPDRPGRQGVVDIANKLTEEGFITGVVWPIYQAADEEPLETMRSTWQRVEGYSWLLRQRIALA